MFALVVVTVLKVFALCNVKAPGTDAQTWRHQAVVYAEAVDVNQDSAAGWRVWFRPLAVLSGNMDAAAEPKLDATVWIGGNSEIDRPPRTGSRLLVAVERSDWGGKPTYSIPNGGNPFSPPNAEGAHPCLFEIRSFGDARITETIENLRKLRGEQRQEIEKARKARQFFVSQDVEEPRGPWQRSAVIYCEVVGFEPRPGGAGRVRLNPLATLTGNFDAAYVGEIGAEVHFGDKSAIRDQPHVGAKALVLLKRDEAGKYSIPDTPVDFFPADDHGNHPAYFEILGFDDPDVEKTIENLRTLRASDREAMEKKEVGANAATDHPKK